MAKSIRTQIDISVKHGTKTAKVVSSIKRVPSEMWVHD